MKQLFLILLLTLSLSGISQKTKFKISESGFKAASTSTLSSQYTFSTFVSTYSTITGTSLTGGLKWDDDTFGITLPFMFKIYSQNKVQLKLFEARTLSFDDINNDPTASLLAPMFEDFCDRAYDPTTDNPGDPGGISPITYTITGSVGNRICKIQYSNLGFYDENNNGPAVSVVNFQTWLYETSNIIEFRFGNVNIQNAATNLTAGSAGFSCFLADSLDTGNGSTPRSNALYGNSASPTMSPFNVAFTNGVSINITNGRVYQFKPTTVITALGKNKQSNISLFPNPAKDYIHINGLSEINKFKVWDLYGKEMDVNLNNGMIDVSSLIKGVYFIEIKQSQNEKQTFKFIKE